MTGTFQPSFFGLSLETLASLPRPIRSSSPAAAALAPGTAGGDLEPVAQVPSVTQQAGEIPPEVLRLTDLLQQGSGLQPPGLFLFTAEAATASSLSTEGSGDANGSPQHGPSEVAAEERGSSSIGAASAAGTSGGSSSTGSEAAAVHGMRDCLDTGAPFPSGAGAHQAAATLLAWFAALPRPLLPAAAAQVCDICEPMVSSSSAGQLNGPCLWERQRVPAARGLLGCRPVPALPIPLVLPYHHLRAAWHRCQSAGGRHAASLWPRPGCV